MHLQIGHLSMILLYRFDYTLFTRINPRTRVAIDPIRLIVSTCFFDLCEKAYYACQYRSKRRYSIMVSNLLKFLEHVRVYTLKVLFILNIRMPIIRTPMRTSKEYPQFNKERMPNVNEIAPRKRPFPYQNSKHLLRGFFPAYHNEKPYWHKRHGCRKG